MSGLIPASRALTVKSAAIPMVAGIPALEPLKLEGSEGVNALFTYQLTLQTQDALAYLADTACNLDLNAFIGRELTCCIELEGQGPFQLGAGVREVSGLITSARLVGEDNRHGVYELTLRPWLHLATLTTDCKVFQNQTPVEVIEAVLADYPFATDKRLIEDYPLRGYCVQYNETDFEFVTRLMQEWGINYHFEHSDGVHRLVFSDHNGAFQTGTYSPIPFYPLGHKIDCAYIHGFSVENRMTRGAYGSRDYDYLRPRATLDASATAPRDTGYADQDVYVWRDDKPAYQTEAIGQQLALLRMQALRQAGVRAQGVGHVREVVAGSTFALAGHPQESANAEYLVLDTSLLIENPGVDNDSGQWRVLVEFVVQPATEVLRPALTQRKPKTGGPETALVVGPGDDTAASNIYTDALGRIKLQFPWDRYGQKNQNSSCWVRVSSTWAGNQLGAMHVPRIGQEVVVGFLGGDPDLPVVTGRVVNQINQPPWSLPEQQALSGFRSRELVQGGGNSAAGRSNHLLLDDTDGHIQAQLKSDHQHSSLSLGHITRIEDNAGRKDWRGEGFELRTDGHGVVRAKGGMLISTEARPNAQAHAKDMGETTPRLSQALDMHDGLSSLAVQHQAHDANQHDDLTKDLQAQNKGIQGGRREEGAFPELADPHIVMASPAGIASTTPGSTHQHSGRQHMITSGAHTSISSTRSLLVTAKDSVRLFAYKTGMKLVSAASDIHINALQTSIYALAKMDITMTTNSIALTANKQVLVNGGGSYMKWSAGGIEEGSAGMRVVHAPSYPVVGPDNMQTPPVVMPAADWKPPPKQLVFSLMTQPELTGGAVRADEPYRLLKDGAVIDKGMTNGAGQIVVKDHQEGTTAYQVQLSNGAVFDLKVSDALDDSPEQRLGNQGYRATAHMNDRALGNGLA